MAVNGFLDGMSVGATQLTKSPEFTGPCGSGSGNDRYCYNYPKTESLSTGKTGV